MGGQIKIGINERALSSVEWRVLFGHAIHVGWGWLMFTGSLFAVPGGDLIDSPLLSDPLYMLSLGANAITLALFAMLGRFAGPLFRREWVPVTAALCMSIGTFFASDLVLLLFGNPTVWVEVFAGIVTGLGTGTFLMVWGEVLVSFGTRGCLVYFAASSFVAAFAHILLSLLPELWIQGVVSLAPIVELLLYRSYVSDNRLAMSKSNRQSSDPQCLPLAVIMLGAFFGFSFGAMRGFSFLLEQAGLRGPTDAVSMAFVMVACVLAYFVSVVSKQAFGRLTYQMALPFVACGLLLLPLSDMWSIVGVASYRIGYQYVYVILWVLWVFFSRRSETTSVWVIACGLASVQVSKLLGFLIVVDAPVLTNQSWNLPLVSSVALFAIILFSLFAREDRLEEKSWEEVRPVSEQGDDRSFVSQNYEPAAVSFGLSPRETEVFYLLLRGRSRAYIAKDLVVTEETVKTHIKGIYQKAGVHTKQDLIDRVENALSKKATESER